jgi:NAD(P)-dependent dehydrogenase (short-subunit alcohol dehydrogenase family)
VIVILATGTFTSPSAARGTSLAAVAAMTNVRDKIVVVTGASSGLGRAIALEATARGAKVALAARRNDDLEVVAEDCRVAGGQAITVETDVSVEADVERLAARAIEEWGAIDVWINNAGVTLFALLEQGPFEPHRRVLETNLFGAIHGARAAVPIFRRQGHGVLINIGSVLSEVGHAFVPSYVISKFGLRGLSEALRVELAGEPDIHVCTVIPYAIDTPHFQVAANELGRKIFAMPPVQQPEDVARAVVDVAERPRRVRHVPRVAALGVALHALRPALTERLLLDSLRRFHLAGPDATGEGNLYQPSLERGAVHGERPPRIGPAAFALWLLLRFARIEASVAAHKARRAFARVQAWRRRAT